MLEERVIKFRQPQFNKDRRFVRWHYWGFVSDKEFIGIETGTMNVADAQRKSQQYLNMHDKKNREVYEGDYVKISGDIVGSGRKSEIGLIESDGGFGYTWRAIIEEDEYDLSQLMIDDDCVVVGNIYQPPKEVANA